MAQEEGHRRGIGLGQEAIAFAYRENPGNIDYLALYASGIGTCQSGGIALPIHLHETEGSCFQKFGKIRDESVGMAFIRINLCHHRLLSVTMDFGTLDNPSYHSGAYRSA